MARTAPSEPFERALRELDRDTLGAFVADVWRARGWDARWDAETGLVTATRNDTSGTRRLFVVDPDGGGVGTAIGADAEIDRVVIAGRPKGWRESTRHTADAGVLDAEDLRRLLRYAVDRETAEALCESHLGVSLREQDGDPSPTTRTESAFRWVPDVSTSTRLAGGVLLVLVLAVPLVTVPGVTEEFAGGSAPARESGPGATTPRTATVADPEPWQGVPPPERTTGTPEGDLAVDRLTDPTALARLHTSLLDRPYRLTLTYEIRRNGSVAVRHTEVLRVKRWNVFRSRSRGGNASTRPWMLTAGAIYADGERLYRRETVNGAVRYSAVRIEYSRWLRPPMAVRMAQFIQVFLTDPTVAGAQRGPNATRYELRSTGDPPAAGIEDVSAWALVNSERGVVSMGARYSNPSLDDGTVVFRAEYRFGNVSVTPPEWYDTARNRTAWPFQPGN